MKTTTQLIADGMAAGVLPSNASLPEDEQAAPWPVLLFGFVGAQFAVLPILAFFGMVSGGFFFKGIATFVLAALLIGAGVALLRKQSKQGFISHIALTLLLIGDGCLAYALFRDAGMQGISFAALVLCAVQLGLAWLIQLRWAQTVLGALAVLAFMWIGNDGWVHHSNGSSLGWLVAWAMPIVAAGLWCCAVLSEPRWSTRPWASMAHAVLLGWAVGLLGLFMFSHGALGAMSQMMGSATTGENNAMPMSVSVTKTLSVVVVLACAMLVQWRWASKAQTRSLLWLAYTALAVLAWFADSVPMLALLATGALLTQRLRLFGLAGLGLAFALSHFYYQLDWRLVDKALLLAVTGAVLGLGAWVLTLRAAARDDHRTTAAPAPGLPSTDGAQHLVLPLIALGAVLALGAANWNIAQKEQVIAKGEKLYVALAPRDPRSLLQGDYMALNFAIPNEVQLALSGQAPRDLNDSTNHLPYGRAALLVAKRDVRGVATVTRIAKANEAIAADEVLLPVKFKSHRWVLVSDAFFFPEGKGKALEAARFGELRALGNGQALLVGLSDDKLQALTPQ